LFRRPLRAIGADEYVLDLAPDERRIVRELCEQLRPLVADGDEAVGRLFPSAYRDDAEASAEYDSLVRPSLVSGRLRALDAVIETADASRLALAQVESWCGALNDVRLVLGERLEVTEEIYETGVDRDDPRGPQLALYGWLTWLQGEFVETLAARL
jgi:Domain of unknown function (DUF2017)